MRQQKTKPKVWTKPEVKRLGVIKDVAAQQAGLAQGGARRT